MDLSASSAEEVEENYLARSAREAKLRIEADPVSETLCSLTYRTINKVKKPSNS
jgi:hypothetical protein